MFCFFKGILHLKVRKLIVQDTSIGFHTQTHMKINMCIFIYIKKYIYIKLYTKMPGRDPGSL